MKGPHENEGEQDTEDGGEAVGDADRLHHLSTQSFVAIVTASVAEVLRDDDEDQGAQDERPEENVDLGRNPQYGAGAERWDVNH